MKIVYDHQIFFAQRYGGISRYFREIAIRLAQRPSVTVRIVAPFHRNEHLRRSPTLGIGSTFFDYRFPYAAAIQQRGRRFLLPLLYERHADADVVHETYYSTTALGTSRVRVMTMHDLIHEKYPHFFEDASQITNAKKLAIRRSAHVICVSESTRRDLINFFDVAPERTSVIHLGFSLTPPARASLEENRISEKPFFLFVGNRGTYKNFARLVQAFASSSALRGDFDLVAFGGSGFSHDEGELLSRLGVANSVKHVTGNDARLAACYRAATAFVFPSLYEGFGIPPLEAMSFGCPVACSASSS